MATSLTLENDSSLAQGYLKVNGSTAATLTTSGITGNLTGNVTGNLTGNVTGNVTGSLTNGGAITLGTAQASTSGTSIDFTGIPSWAKRITVMLSGVSTSGSSNLRILLGNSGGFETTGYTSKSAPTAGTGSSITTGFLITTITDPADLISGTNVITLVGSNIWVSASSFSLTSTGNQNVGSGTKTLSSTLDRIRITTVNGTDTFDAGTINISYEG